MNFPYSPGVTSISPPVWPNFSHHPSFGHPAPTCNTYGAPRQALPYGYPSPYPYAALPYLAPHQPSPPTALGDSAHAVNNGGIPLASVPRNVANSPFPAKGVTSKKFNKPKATDNRKLSGSKGQKSTPSPSVVKEGSDAPKQPIGKASNSKEPKNKGKKKEDLQSNPKLSGPENAGTHSGSQGTSAKANSPGTSTPKSGTPELHGFLASARKKTSCFGWTPAKVATISGNVPKRPRFREDRSVTCQAKK